MKNKFLLSALLGSALLVGCTADDALDANKVAQKVNPSAPVFNVRFNDNEGTSMRGDMSTGLMRWLTTDKMSLYHSGGDVTGEGKTWSVTKYDDSNFLETGKIRDFDAIYTQVGDGETATFATETMVGEGLAIMIYPADTAYAQTGKSPVIKISREQDENTKNLTPFVSEVLKIGEYNGDNTTHTAGYGRQYDLTLRRIGAQLRLSLDAENGEAIEEAGVPAIEYRKVKIGVADPKNDEDNIFTTESFVKVGQPRYTDGSEDAKKAEYEVGLNPKDGSHDYWAFTPWIEPNDDNTNQDEVRSSWISTTDITNEFNEYPTAFFTLLPCEDRSDIKTLPVESTEDGVKANYGALAITVTTNYGKIVVEDDAEDDKVQLWSRKNSTTGAVTTEQITPGLATFIDAAFTTPKEGSENYPLYRKQVNGNSGTRYLKVDLDNLDMKFLHITNGTQLQNAIKVYNVVYKDSKEKVTFILDGGKDGNPEGKFVMDEPTWKAVKDQLATTGNNLSIAPCAVEGEECTTVVLKSATAGSDVPALQFAKAIGDDDEEVSDVELTVELDGTWNYVSTDDASKYLNLTGIAHLNVVEGATLNAKGYITAKGDFDITVNKGAFMVIPAGASNVAVVAGKTLYNRGTITINDKATLTAAANGVIWNCAAEMKYNNKGVALTTGLSDGSGTVLNYGTLASRQGTNGVVHNRGLIEVKNGTAATLVTTNQTTSVFINKPFKSDDEEEDWNIAGTIVLFQPDGNSNQTKVTAGTNKQGFIKIVLDSEKPSKDEIGTIANYLEVSSKCKELNSGSWQSADGKTTINGVPTNIRYIESHGTEVMMKGTYTLWGLLVPEGLFRVTGDATVNLTNGQVYVPNGGRIIKSGSMTGGFVYKGYFGGADTDSNNVEELPAE